MLTEDEYQALCEKLGKKAADEQIEALSLYMGQSQKNAKKYTNHYLTVLNWSRQKAERGDVRGGKEETWIERAERIARELNGDGEQPKLLDDGDMQVIDL